MLARFSSKYTVPVAFSTPFGRSFRKNDALSILIRPLNCGSSAVPRTVASIDQDTGFFYRSEVFVDCSAKYAHSG